MTSAHRPTWNPAVGGMGQGGTRSHAPTRQYSSRDLPGHTKLKIRQPGQNTKDEVQHRNLKTQLEERERKHFKTEARSERDEERILALEDSESVQKREQVQESRTKYKDENERIRDKFRMIDADDEDDQSESESESDSEDEKSKGSDSEDSESEDDDESELLRELEKIKKERAEEQRRKIEEESMFRQRHSESAVLRGNPLLNQDVDFTLKRKWFDDSVFKNQARNEPLVKKRFINDTIRNDFHKKFLTRYIQ